MTQLERRYRWLLACYPKAFRREHEDEMLAVLLAGAGDARRLPGLTEAADLIGNAVWLRLRPAPRSSRAVLWTIRLTVLAAALELVALITVLATQGSLRSAILRHFPHFTAAQWHATVQAYIVPVEIGAPITAAAWLWIAWANGRGHTWSKGLVAGLFSLTSVSLLAAFAQHTATYAPADLICVCALWLVGLATVLLILTTASSAETSRSLLRPD